MENYTLAIIIGVLVGFVSRLLMLRTDYRQYPTYPHGRVIHISLGLIAAGLGAIAVPALFEQDYTAITFLALAAQQFRDVRNMERNSLQQLDEMELVPRGSTYIEGIAMVFEGRNYLVIFSAFLTSLSTVFWGWQGGVIIGILTLVVDASFMSGKLVKDVAEVRQADVRIDGPDLYVDDIYIMNVGLEDTREKIKKVGLGFVLTPHNENSIVTISNIGQRQAILHDVSTILGVYRDTGEPSLVPLSKRSLDDGRLGVFLIPQNRNPRKAMEIIRHVPVLEGAIRMPSESEANE
ncbi:MAG: YIEGIA domain-containing protein [Bacillaceae bacterium]|nr:YIEGIA domain-containing protein [Bacillaceae bacterium]